MDKSAVQIIDTITAHLGEPLSINQLTQKMKERYGKAYYSNIYKKLHELTKDGFLQLSRQGRASIVRLNFSNYLLTDFLSEIEIEKKIALLKQRIELLQVLSEIESGIQRGNLCEIGTILLINPWRNIKLNRIELIFTSCKEAIKNQDAIRLYNAIEPIEKRLNIRIDSLLLSATDFDELMKSEEINPLREAISAKIAIFCPQAFWKQIANLSEESEIKTISEETIPACIPEQDLVYNLFRLGYSEFGSNIEQGKKYCIEYLVIALLLQEDQRRREAVPIILAKNRFNPNLLAFLSQKYKTGSESLGILNALEKIKPTKETNETIAILHSLRIDEKPVDEADMRRKMRLYNAT